MNTQFLAAKKAIDKSEKILLASHDEPDGDALGSMLALKFSFEKLGKKADIFCPSEIPENFRFLPGIQEVKKNIELKYDLLFGVDYGDLKRLEAAVKDIPLITFDHHPLINQAGEIKVVDTNFSSTCEIVYQFLAENELKIDKEIATCLLTGIFTDTWGFRHPNTTAKTLKVVGELLLRGAPLRKIAGLVNQQKIDVKSKIWSRALTNIQQDREFGFVYCFINFQDMKELGATTGDLSGLASLLCMVPGTKFSLVLSEMALGKLDGSFRALPNHGIDVSRLAKALGGGGHKLSAGFKTEGTSEAVIERIKNLINPNTK
jgi:bifunctional oligoribonuclease and PAP phosphatase NrnA